jgi:TonB-linked SusC/RagA family outer membrane protein
MKNNLQRQLIMLSKRLMYAFLFQLFLCTVLLASTGKAQHKSIKEVKVSLNLMEQSLDHLFKQVESKSDFKFTYTDNLVDLKQPITVVENNKSLYDVLVAISMQTKLNFVQVNENIHVKARTGNSEDKAVKVILKADINVRGVVKDKSGEPFPGVTVLVKGTTTGAATGLDGSYALTAPEGATLVFSFIGFETQEISIGNQSTIDVTLNEDETSLSEVVVVGYGTQLEREVTGSVATFEAKQLQDLPVGQFTQKLQGRLAGVQISQATGTPGGGMAIRIRGAASINAGNNPLFVVDGFPIVGDINNINPNEIESFSVLKGASAAALYGSRAANGVVLITTKQAKSGQNSVELNVIKGFTQVPERGKYKLMNAKEFLADRKAIYEDKIKYEGFTGGIPALYQNPESWTGPDTDWYEELLQGGTQDSYNLSFLSSKDNFSSATTLGYFEEKGVVLNTGFNRFSFRTNNEYKINENMRVGVNVAPTYQTSKNQATDGYYEVLYAAIITPPIFSPDDVDANGNQKVSFTGPGLFTFPNWKKTVLETENKTVNLRLLTNAYFEANFLSNFTFKSSVAVDLGARRNKVFNSSTTGGIFSPPPKPATGSYSTQTYDSWLTENTLNYKKTFKDHSLDVIVGYSAQKYSTENNSLTGTNYADDQVSWIDAAATRYGSNNISEWSLLSGFSRLNYNFKGKYLLSVSARRDGSSRFGAENKWGNFPAVSAGWILSDEGFAKNWSIVNFLKLRAEYGSAGNFNIGNYSQFGNIASTNYVFNNSLVQGRSPITLGNSFLTWETTVGYDLGIDIGLLDDRISLVLDFYDKSTKNMLYQVDIPTGAGFSNIQDNIGEFHFWGYEFGVNARVIQKDLFTWNSDFNISFNRNKVIQLGTNNVPLGGIGDYSSTIWKTEVGYPIGQFYGYVFDGIYKTQEEFNSQPKHVTSRLGTIRFKDINGDGKITADDKTYIGNPNPKFFFGFNNSFTYRNFDMSISMAGSYGGKMYYSISEWSETLEGIFNVEKYMVDRWRSVENPGKGIIGRSLSGTTAFPRSTQDRLALDASHLTIKNISIGYRLPQINKYLKSARIFASIQQALVLTKYAGPNPEASWQGLNGLREGVDVSPYPMPRTYALGVNFNF